MKHSMSKYIDKLHIQVYRDVEISICKFKQNIYVK